MRWLALLLSVVALAIGLYLKFFNDVPDSQEQINFFVSGFLIILGIGSALMNAVWTGSPTHQRRPGSHASRD
jgi:hypothetical protein